MINFDSHNINKIYYNGHEIKAAYGCNGELVFGEEPPTPTPTGMTGLKVSGTTLYQGDFSKECEISNNELLPHDMPTASAITKVEVGTCVNLIGMQSLANKANVVEIILPSTILYFREYEFLGRNTSIQNLTIYAITPPTFLNYVEDEWEDIFGYRYPSSSAPAGFKIYVPSGSVNAYKTATGWSHMADYIEPIPTPKLLGILNNGTTIPIECDSASTVEMRDVVNLKIEINNQGYSESDLVSLIIGNCVTSIICSLNDRYNFTDFINMSSVTISNTVTTINDFAFRGCSGLTNVTIGSGITTIGEDAFYSCSGLTGITINATVPPTLDGDFMFDKTNNCPIYVPAESVEAYKNASIWKDYYEDRIQPIPT